MRLPTALLTLISGFSVCLWHANHGPYLVCNLLQQTVGLVAHFCSLVSCISVLVIVDGDVSNERASDSMASCMRHSDIIWVRSALVHTCSAVRQEH